MCLLAGRSRGSHGSTRVTDGAQAVYETTLLRCDACGVHTILNPPVFCSVRTNTDLEKTSLPQLLAFPFLHFLLPLFLFPSGKLVHSPSQIPVYSMVSPFASSLRSLHKQEKLGPSNSSEPTEKSKLIESPDNEEHVIAD